MGSNEKEDFKQIHEILHRFDVPEYLLKIQSDDLSAIDINVQDEHGFTTLMIEVLRGKTNAIELLLMHGALTEVENDSGETALFIAIEEGNPVMVDLISMYSNINYTNKNGDNAFGIAKYFGNNDVLDILRKYDPIDTGEITFIEAVENDACGPQQEP